MFREPKRGVSDYHQRRMFAHGYHFIAEQVTLPTNTETEKETNTQTDRQEKRQIPQNSIKIVFSGANLEMGKAKPGNNAADSEESVGRTQGI